MSTMSSSSFPGLTTPTLEKVIIKTPKFRIRPPILGPARWRRSRVCVQPLRLSEGDVMARQVWDTGPAVEQQSKIGEHLEPTHRPQTDNETRNGRAGRSGSVWC